MKKSLLLAIVLSFYSASCFASVNSYLLALGGLVPGNTPEYIRSVFGTPTKVVDSKYFYGKGFEISFHDNFAVSIVSKANNGIGTPSGIRYGSTITEVMKKLGNPDKLPFYLRNEKNLIRYTDGDNGKNSRDLFIKFKDSRVVELTLTAAEAR